MVGVPQYTLSSADSGILADKVYMSFLAVNLKKNNGLSVFRNYLGFIFIKEITFVHTMHASIYLLPLKLNKIKLKAI